MPAYLTQGFYTSGGGWSATGSVPLTFDGAANVGIFVLAQIDNIAAGTTVINSAVLDPTGLNINLALDAARSLKSGSNWMQGYGSVGDPAQHFYSAKGLTVPAGTRNLVVTCSNGNAKLRVWAIVVTDAASAIYSDGVNPGTTGNTINFAVSSAPGRLVLALGGWNALPDTATVTVQNGGTSRRRVLLTDVSTTAGVIATYPGASSVTFGAQPSGSGVASNYKWGAFTWDIEGAPPPTMNFTGTVPAQSGTAGTAFSWSGAALSSYFSGGTAPYTYSVFSGTLPAGLSINASTGVVSGTPSAAGSATVVFRATDAATGVANTNSVTFTIAPAPATALTFSGPSAGPINAASSNFTVGANGAITGSILVTPSSNGGGGTFNPTSVTISAASPTATFQYTPTTVGAKTISVSNDGGLTPPADLTYTASSAVSFVGPNVSAQFSVVGVPFSLSLASLFAGGTTPYTYSIASGTLPAGMSLNATTGVISGTPTTAGSSSAVIRATDSQGSPTNAVTNSISFTVTAPGRIMLTNIPDDVCRALSGGTAMANATATVHVHDATTGALLISQSITTDASGLFGTISSPLLALSTQYRIDYRFSTGEYGVVYRTTEAS